MSLDTLSVLAHRRMRRRLTLWRSLAVIAGVFALVVIAESGSDGGLSGIFQTNQIARVTIEGTILDDRSQVKMLKKIRDADHVKALLVFVNSPGGTTTGGESLFNNLRGIAKKKPVVAQFGTVATSAGYIVGLGADHIVTRGNTITGSVGVLAQWPEVTQMLDKLGIAFNEVKSGKLKAQPNPFSPANPDATQVMQETIDDGFSWFLSLVKTRRSLDPAQVPGLTDGRIYSGRQALKYKLVDAIGGEDAAVDWLVKERGVDKDTSVIDWKPETADPTGFTGAIGRAISGVFSAAVNRVISDVAATPGLGGVALDGLVSVWQPSKN